MRGWLAYVMVVCMVLCPALTLAQTSGTDLQVAARALSFLNHPPSGTLTVGIVYVPDNVRSVEEATLIRSLLVEGLRVGNLTLRPQLVRMSEVNEATVQLFFLTAGVGADAEILAEAAHKRHLLCVTTDIPQVLSGRCALGVRSQPKVEIIVNRALAATSGIGFSTVFRVMITEI
ncbi:MAG TPA: hypothetical protein VI653_17215 [Steroidobacteraceae bacterium]